MGCPGGVCGAPNNKQPQGGRQTPRSAEQQHESDSDDDESPFAAMVQAISGSGSLRSDAEKAESEKERRAKGDDLNRIC